MTHPTILVELSNNNQTLIALVEQDQHTAYFYIVPAQQFEQQFPIRACWLRNLKPAPDQFEQNADKAGHPPMLPSRFCHTPHAQAPLNKKELSIVWTESDDGAYLYYQNRLIAVIPGGSLYVEQPMAYSSECHQENDLVLPLGTPQNNELFSKAEDCQLFFHQWQQQDSSPWPDIQQQFLACYEQQFGPSIKYYAIDGGHWPPMAISQHEKQGVTYFFTLGMSIRPMPWVDILFPDNAEQYRRIELAIAIDNQQYDQQTIMEIAEKISGLAHLPWGNISWLGEGHTYSISHWQGYDSVILSSLLSAHKTTLPEMYNEQPTLLWATPIYENERILAHSQPNGGHHMIEILQQRGVSHIIKQRKSSQLQ